MDTDAITDDSNIETPPQDLTCSHCGRTASDVYLYPKLVAGHFVKVPECQMASECWKRYDQQHGIPSAA